MKTLDATITNTSNIINVRSSDSHGASSGNVVFECESTTLDLNDSVDISIGYITGTNKVLTGYIKQIERSIPDNTYVLTAQDVMVRAMDYFIASDDPEVPLSYLNTQAEDLVGDLMTKAGLTNYQGDTTNFEFGITQPVEVNLTSSYEFSQWVADLLAWHLYADTNGKVWFVDRKPYPTGSDSSSYTIEEKETISITKNTNERDLRNKVIVYGRNGISAKAQASSPYLPAGYYKTVVVASEWIDTTSMAQDAADYNLDKLNRITKELAITIEGNSTISARDIVSVNNSYLDTSGLWYVYAIEHSWGDSGFITNLQLRQ